MTTGATLAAAAVAARDAGARRVECGSSRERCRRPRKRADRDVRRRARPSGDSAEHRQRDPPHRQHGHRTAPRRAARLPDGRPRVASAPGLDYHEYARVSVHRDFAACRAALDAAAPRRWFAFTTQAARSALRRRATRRATCWCSAAKPSGLPDDVLAQFAPEARLRIPMRPGRAQPQPVERGRRRRLRSVAPGRVRRRELIVYFAEARAVHPQCIHQETQLVVAVDRPAAAASCRCRGRCRSPCTAGTATPGPDCSAPRRRISSRAADRRASRIRRQRRASPACSRPRARSGTASSAGSSGNRRRDPGRRIRRSSTARSGTCDSGPCRAAAPGRSRRERDPGAA